MKCVRGWAQRWLVERGAAAVNPIDTAGPSERAAALARFLEASPAPRSDRGRTG